MDPIAEYYARKEAEAKRLLQLIEQVERSDPDNKARLAQLQQALDFARDTGD